MAGGKKEKVKLGRNYIIPEKAGKEKNHAGAAGFGC